MRLSVVFLLFSLVVQASEHTLPKREGARQMTRSAGRKVFAPPTACACDNRAVLGCKGSAAAATFATADFENCRIDAPEAVCKVLGHADGDIEPDIAAVLKSQDWFQGPRFAGTSSAIEVLSICSYIHEAKHICDGKAVKRCQSEQSGYDISNACAKRYLDTFCKETSSETCQAVTAMRYSGLVARYLNQEICAGTSAQKMVDACAKNWWRAECEKNAAVYVPNFSREYHRPNLLGSEVNLTSGRYRQRGGTEIWQLFAEVSNGRMRGIFAVDPGNNRFHFDCPEGTRCAYEDQTFLELDKSGASFTVNGRVFELVTE